MARANEVLTNDEERKKLDYYMDNPAEYWQLYGSYISYAYAPKSSVLTVVLMLLLFASAMQPAIQMSKHSQYVDKLKKAALLKLPVGGGGTPESIDLRRRAEEKVLADDKSGKKKSGKVDRKKLAEAVDELIHGLNIQGEFRKPCFWEVPIVRLVAFPANYSKVLYRRVIIEYKRFNRIELTEDEKQEVIEKYLGGPVAWDALTDEDQDALIAGDCWQRVKFNEWLRAYQERESEPAREQDMPALKAETQVTSGSLSAKGKQQLRQRRKAPQVKFTMED